MQHKIFLIISFFIFLTSCSKTQGPYGIDDKRGTFNQPIIRITRAPDGPSADRKLMEEQGYHVAKDRMLQIDLMRRLSRGSLSEIFGQDAVSMDEMNWGVTNLPQSAIRSTARVEKDYKDIFDLLQAYADGVNRYIREIPSSNTSLSDQYHFLTKNADYVPDPWQPVDSIAIAESVAYYLSSSLQQKLIFGAMLNEFISLGRTSDFAKFLDLRPFENVSTIKSAMKEGMAPLAFFNRLTGNQAAMAYSNFKCLGMEYPMRPCGIFGEPGSNNWVLSGDYTGTGESIVANDPHLSIQMPMAFYESALDSTPAGGTFKVAGFQVAGLPGVLIGHNDRVAWAMTNNAADVEDVYIEQMDRTGKSVKFQGKTVPITVQNHTLLVRDTLGGISQKQLTLRYVPHHGPIISDHIASISANMVPNTAISYRWTGHSGTTEFVAMMNVDRAHNFNEFKDALQSFEVGAQNIVYADVDGNIGYYSHANYPVRNWENYSTEEGALPYVPLDGTGTFEWKGFRKEVPELYNPPAKRIVTANQDPYGYNEAPNLSNFHDYFGFAYANGVRAARIMTLLEEARKKGPITWQEVQKIQFDHLDGAALKYVAMLRQQNDVAKELSPAGRELFESLLAWDGQMTRNQRQPVMYYAWLREMLTLHYSTAKQFPESLQLKEGETADQSKKRIAENDEMLRMAGFTPYGIMTVYHQWSEALATNDKAIHELLVDSLNNAATSLKNSGLYGKRWGVTHPIQFFNQLAGILPDLFISNVERDGSYDTVDMSGFPIGSTYDKLPERLPNTIGPNFRLIMTLKNGEPIKGYAVVPGGNWDPMKQKDNINQELNMYRNGKMRELVSF
jgi:penicillin G amidase